MTDWDPTFCTRSRWHTALAPLAEAFAAHDAFPTCEALTMLAAARAHVCPPPTFALQSQKPRRRARTRSEVEVASRYDGQVALSGTVPTRAQSWHDLYNALVFIAFSRAKRALHARQFRAAQAAIPEGATRVPGRRTREQDHLTILDEGSVLVACPPGEQEAVEQRIRARGAAAFDDPDVRAVVFGHAVYEHFHFGRPPIRAMTIVLALPSSPATLAADALIDALDVALTEALEAPETFMDPSHAFSTLLGA